MATTKKPVPSLSDQGWITSLSVSVDRLLVYFFETDYLQSYLYNRNISSFAALIAKYPTDMIGLQSEIQRALEGLLNRYFDNTVLDITITENTKGDMAGSMNIIIVIQITQDGEVYTANRLISLVNSKFVSLTNYINTGV